MGNRIQVRNLDKHFRRQCRLKAFASIPLVLACLCDWMLLPHGVSRWSAAAQFRPSFMLRSGAGAISPQRDSLFLTFDGSQYHLIPETHGTDASSAIAIISIQYVETASGFWAATRVEERCFVRTDAVTAMPGVDLHQIAIRSQRLWRDGDLKWPGLVLEATRNGGSSYDIRIRWQGIVHNVISGGVFIGAVVMLYQARQSRKKGARLRRCECPMCGYPAANDGEVCTCVECGFGLKD